MAVSSHVPGTGIPVLGGAAAPGRAEPANRRAMNPVACQGRY
jgi:hypothetical protein